MPQREYSPQGYDPTELTPLQEHDLKKQGQGDDIKWPEILKVKAQGFFNIRHNKFESKNYDIFFTLDGV